MVTRIVLAALVAALVSAPAVGVAQQQKKADCPQPSASPGAQAAPQRIEGEVTQINRQTSMVTLRMPDGSVAQFRGNKETLDDLEVGDRIEAKKRTPDC